MQRQTTFWFTLILNNIEILVLIRCVLLISPIFIPSEYRSKCRVTWRKILSELSPLVNTFTIYSQTCYLHVINEIITNLLYFIFFYFSSFSLVRYCTETQDNTWLICFFSPALNLSLFRSIVLSKRDNSSMFLFSVVILDSITVLLNTFTLESTYNRNLSRCTFPSLSLSSFSLLVVIMLLK